MAAANKSSATIRLLVGCHLPDSFGPAVSSSERNGFFFLPFFLSSLLILLAGLCVCISIKCKGGLEEEGGEDEEDVGKKFQRILTAHPPPHTPQSPFCNKDVRFFVTTVGSHSFFIVMCLSAASRSRPPPFNKCRGHNWPIFIFRSPHYHDLYVFFFNLFPSCFFDAPVSLRKKSRSGSWQMYNSGIIQR